MIMSNHPKRLRDDQRRRLDLLHEKLEAVVSVREEEYLRTEGALLGSTEWEEFRELAREALRSFGWPLEAPPKGKHKFIGPDGAFLPLLRTALTVPRCCFAVCSVTAALVGHSSSCLRD